MTTQRPSESEIFAKVDDTFTGLDQERLAGLQQMQGLQAIKQQTQQQEKKRLTLKYGEDHPRVVKINERMRYDEAANIELHHEIEKSQIKLPDVDRNSWLVHGRVLDQNRKGVPKLTLSLHDENDQWLEALGHACTNEQGYFVLRYHGTEGQEPRIPDTQKLFLIVTDAENQVRHRETEPLYLDLGVIDYRLIVLTGKIEVCTPPKPESGSSSGLPKDAWIALGTVKDEQGNPLPGLIVSLYDKDLLFDDSLGTTTTDAGGNFYFIYRTEAFNKLFDSNPELYLKVLDSSGRVLYNSRSAVRTQVGRVEEFKIVLPQRKI